MTARQTVLFTLALLAPLAAAADNAKAVADFGTEKSDPIQTGFLFINNTYIETPYIVERRGLDILINGQVVRHSPEYPPHVTPTDVDPGDPPAGSSPFDPTLAGQDSRDGYWHRKFKYLQAHFEREEAIQKMVDAYSKSSDIASVKPEADHKHAYIVTRKNGKTVPVDFSFHKESPRDYLAEARGSIEHYASILRAGMLISLAEGTEMGVSKPGVLTYLEAIVHTGTAAEKQKMIEKPETPENPDAKAENAKLRGTFGGLVSADQTSKQSLQRYEALKAASTEK
jgi:hypothetical protein